MTQFYKMTALPWLAFPQLPLSGLVAIHFVCRQKEQQKIDAVLINWRAVCKIFLLWIRYIGMVSGEPREECIHGHHAVREQSYLNMHQQCPQCHWYEFQAP